MTQESLVRIVVTGGRGFSDRELLAKTLDNYSIAELAQGGASGADRLAKEWAKANNTPVVTFEADWKQFGYAAGPMRNLQMLKDFAPDLVVAFPGGSGTADCVRKARQLGFLVVVVKQTDTDC